VEEQAHIKIYVQVQVYLEGLVMQVAKWGNSLAVRLPRSVVDALGLKEGDNIEIHVAGRRAFEIERAPAPRAVAAAAQIARSPSC